MQSIEAGGEREAGTISCRNSWPVVPPPRQQSHRYSTQYHNIYCIYLPKIIIAFLSRLLWTCRHGLRLSVVIDTIQGVPKVRIHFFLLFCQLLLIQIIKVGGVLQNNGNLLQDFQNSCAHHVANFLNFLKLPKFYDFDK